MLPGVWKLLIPGSAIDSNLFNIKAMGFDRTNQCLYSIIHKKIIRYDLKTNTVTALPATNWPGDFTEFTYDYTNKRLLLWRGGRDSLYALPNTGGSWQAIGPGAIDRECFGASAYWNPISGQPGFYGGYGFNKTKSWIYENDGTQWIQKKTDPLIDSTPAKGGNLMGSSNDGTRLFLFSGQGNYTGNELSGSCSLGSPWATANGMYCWLRDLWELDLRTYRFTNILPVNSRSIQYEGVLCYYDDRARFYLFGGYQPGADFTANQNLPNTNRTFYYRRGIDTGFAEIQGEGDIPPAMPHTLLNNYAYYDVAAKRMIWARFDGIWAYYPDSTTVPPSFRSVLWSTGDTSSTISIKPQQTTLYKVTRILGSQNCKDSILISVTPMQTGLKKTTDICGNRTQLDAGNGFSTYLWNTGDTTQTIDVAQNGIYTVTVSKSNCTIQDSTKVQFAIPVADFTVSVAKDSICPGETDSLFISVQQPGISYSWRQTGNPFVLNTGGSYLVNGLTVSRQFTISANSNPVICSTKTVTAAVIVRTQLQRPQIKTDSLTANGALVSWQPVMAAADYSISMDDGRSYAPPSGIGGLSQRITGLQPNTPFRILLRATGRFSCETSDTVSVNLVTLNPFGNGIYVPNVFTPNGDGVNDTWQVYGTAISSVRLRIYNAWGTQVFATTDLHKGWDGNQGGQKLPAGLYTYSLEATMQDGSRITKAGQFSLVR